MSKLNTKPIVMYATAAQKKKLQDIAFLLSISQSDVVGMLIDRAHENTQRVLAEMQVEATG